MSPRSYKNVRGILWLSMCSYPGEVHMLIHVKKVGGGLKHHLGNISNLVSTYWRQLGISCILQISVPKSIVSEQPFVINKERNFFADVNELYMLYPLFLFLYN